MARAAISIGLGIIGYIVATQYVDNPSKYENFLLIISYWIGPWLAIVFLDRFFRISQFKRTAIPNAPKVGSGGSLSPRSDWRAPSDSTATAWLQELRARVPES